VASAWLIEPRIAERLTVIWIGGHEHDGLAEPPPGGSDMEYNLHIDPIAGQVVFNDSDLRIWQVPRNMYRTVIASRAELLVRMRPHGDLGRYLFDALAEVVQKVVALGMHLGETYVLGDSPLVLLTALVTAFEPGTASSFHVTRPCPRIADTGLYEPDPEGRPLRIYTQLDNRTLLEDLYAKLQLHALGLA
jgi:purine nucleosidase